MCMEGGDGKCFPKEKWMIFPQRMRKSKTIISIKWILIILVFLGICSLSLFFFLQNPILCNWTLYRSVLTRAPQMETVIFFPDSILLQYNLRLLHIFSTYPRHISDHNELVQHTWYHRCDYFPGLIYQSSVAYLDIIRNQLHHKTLQIIRVFFFPGPDI